MFSEGITRFRAGEITPDRYPCAVTSGHPLVCEVAPQIYVHFSENTVARSMYWKYVKLTYALKWLDDLQKLNTHTSFTATSMPAQKLSPGITNVFLTVDLQIVIAGRK
jgi:hypothetical protein